MLSAFYFMAEGLKKNIVNYSLNIAIIIIASLCLYLAYSLVMNTSGTGSRGDLKNSGDTTEKRITNQPNLSIQIDLINATGENRIAAKYRDYLKQKGYDVVDMGNYKVEVAKTMVVDKFGDYNKAKRVAEALGVSSRNIVTQLDKSKYIDVSVIIGKDYAELKPYTEKVK